MQTKRATLKLPGLAKVEMVELMTQLKKRVKLTEAVQVLQSDTGFVFGLGFELLTLWNQLRGISTAEHLEMNHMGMIAQ